MTLSHTFDAPRTAVWDAMLDPEVLARVIPGVQHFERVAEDRYDATLKLGLPAVRGEYRGQVRIRDKEQDPERYSYVLEGSGRGTQGWVEGSARIALMETDGRTRMDADVEARIGGRIAGVAQRMMEGVAKMLAEEFFASFGRELAGAGVPTRGPLAFALRALAGFLRRVFRGAAR